jgi:hypothetical protein
LITRDWFESATLIEKFQIDVFLELDREIYQQENISLLDISLDGDCQVNIAIATTYHDDLINYYRKAAVSHPIDQHQKYRYFAFNLKLGNQEKTVVFQMLLSQIESLYQTISHQPIEQILFYDKSYVHEYEVYFLDEMIFFRSYSYYEKERETIFKVPLETFKSKFLQSFELLKILLNIISTKLDVYPW